MGSRKKPLNIANNNINNYSQPTLPTTIPPHVQFPLHQPLKTNYLSSSNSRTNTFTAPSQNPQLLNCAPYNNTYNKFNSNSPIPIKTNNKNKANPKQIKLIYDN